jgi:hypothetical protein
LESAKFDNLRKNALDDKLRLTELEAYTADLEIQVNSKERLIQEMVLEASGYRVAEEDLREKLEEKENLIKNLEIGPSKLGDKERMANLGALLDGWVGENGDSKSKSDRDASGSVCAEDKNGALLDQVRKLSVTVKDMK